MKFQTMWLALPIPFWSKSSELACAVLTHAASNIIDIWVDLTTVF
jgi:hypothetical protein